MRYQVQNPGSLEKATALLDAVLRDEARRNLTDVATEIGLPRATAHRIATTLVATGFLQRCARGRFLAGPALAGLAPWLDPGHVMATLSRPLLARLARRTGCITHLGRMDDDMVTYLVKEGVDRASLLTQEGMQFEAYCTGIGKVLLAQLPTARLEEYLATGPFVALTPNTVVDPAALRQSIARARAEGYAVDDGEIAPDLHCLAVPVAPHTPPAHFAISLSRVGAAFDAATRTRLLSLLQTTATEIAGLVSPYGTARPLPPKNLPT